MEFAKDVSQIGNCINKFIDVGDKRRGKLLKKRWEICRIFLSEKRIRERSISIKIMVREHR